MTNKRKKHLKLSKAAGPYGVDCTVWDDKSISAVRELVANCETISEAFDVIEEETELSRKHIQRLNTKYGFWLPEKAFRESKLTLDPTSEIKGRLEEAVTEQTFSKDGNEMSTTVRTCVSNVNDVIRICNVDLNEWEPRSFSVHDRASGNPAWRVSFAKKKPQIDPVAIFETFAKMAKTHEPAYFDVEPIKNDGDNLYVLSIQDLHLGKLGWGKETNWADYDINIAKEVYRETVIDLMSKVPQEAVDKVLLIVGSDFLHCDSAKNMTTNGTPLDVDTRWNKMFEEGCKLMVETIEMISSKYSTVVMVVPGNHAALSEYALGAYLGAWFRNNPNVEVNNKPSKRKYFGYGSTLIGFTHGDSIRLEDLPITVMRENQSEISQYKYIEIITGDKHQEYTKEIKGCKVRISPALSGTDKWHSDNGYVGNVRNAQGFLYNFTDGLMATYYSKPVE